MQTFSCILIQHHKAVDLNEQLPTPLAVDGDAPRDFNGFTDGGLDSPHDHQWALGGAGVWWPVAKAPLKEGKPVTVEKSYA